MCCSCLDHKQDLADPGAFPSFVWDHTMPESTENTWALQKTQNASLGNERLTPNSMGVPCPFLLWLTEKQMTSTPHMWGSQFKGQGTDSSVLLCPMFQRGSKCTFWWLLIGTIFFIHFITLPKPSTTSSAAQVACSPGSLWALSHVAVFLAIALHWFISPC